MRLSIVHETKYRYTDPAFYSIQYLRLSPPTTPTQKVLNWKLELPVPAKPFQDGFGNTAHVLVIDRPHQEIRIRARGEVVVDDEPAVLPDTGVQRPDIFMRPTELTAQDENLARFAETFRRQTNNNRAAAMESLMTAVREKVDYKPGVTNVHTSAAKAFQTGAGVCQDHAHVFVACCRQLEIPARYVSGYLAPRRVTDQAGARQEMASHAWAEAWIQGVGWQGFDVANNVRAHGRHVRLAVGLDYLDACPVRGFRRGGSGESMGVEVWVNESLVQEESSAEPGALLRPADARALAAQRQHQRLVQQQQQQQQQAWLIR
jgi:transglutaminase-like putative cysteine protease